MKTAFLSFAFAGYLAAGMISSVAQTNPTSTNGVDVEMELAWPDAQVYANEINDFDVESYTEVAYDAEWLSYTTNHSTTVNAVNWGETAGGSGVSSFSDIYSYLDNIDRYNYDDNYSWPSGRYPELANGYYTVLPGGGTNIAGPPSGISFYGTANFLSSDGFVQYDLNNQQQLMLVTGGLPGTTNLELYQISASGWTVTYTDQFEDGSPAPLDPRQIQIGALGSLTTPVPIPQTSPTTYSGSLFVVLPSHTEIPITPYVAGSTYNEIPTPSVQGYQLKSQCLATIPSSQARTTIGVGEQVNVYFNPALPTNVIPIWSTTAGSLSAITNQSTQLTAPANATNLTISAKLFGKFLSVSFNVIAPTGYVSAQIISTNHYATGLAAAEMILHVLIGPTNVSFYKVQIEEIGEYATNVSGYFTNYSAISLYHGSAFNYVHLNQDNTYDDEAGLGPLPPPPPTWSAGAFTWPIPANWKVGLNGTNYISGWNEVFTVDGTGSVTINKFGRSVLRTTNDIITTH